MIDTEALRKKVIDLAIRGKLTEQLPEDGTAEELYAQIQEEKARLVQEGKIKKEKPLPAIEEDEIPFEIPKNWKWVRWGNVINIVSARRVHQSDWRSKGIPFYRAREIARLADEGSVNNDLFISEELYNDFSKSGVPKSGDLMVTGVGTLGKTYVVRDNDRFYYKDASVLCFENIAGLNPPFLKILMDSSLTHAQISNNSGGTTVDTLTMVRMNRYIFPLPPLAEQKRIADKIDEAFSEIDRIDALQSQYCNNIESLKSKIIDAGIRGKLTEQLPTDGTAEELYAQIQEEKARLVKEGKIKKQKPLTAIETDEIPFELPKKWKWVRLIDLANIINGDRGKNYPAKSTLSKNGIPFISALNLNGSGIDEDDRLLCLSDEQFNKLNSGKLQKNDIVICIRGSLGKHGRYPYNKGAIASSLVICRPYCFSDEIGGFLMKWLDSSLFPKEVDKYDGGAAQPNLAANNLQKFMVPLPPLAEQKRIADKIDEILQVIQ